RSALHLMKPLVEGHRSLPFSLVPAAYRRRFLAWSVEKRFANCSIDRDTPDFGASSTTGAPLFTDWGTTTSLGISESAFTWRVRSTSLTSCLNIELALFG